MVNKNKIIEPNLEAMAESGVHLGTLRSTSNPKMKPYIWSSKNAFQIINLEESKKNLDAALEFLAKIKENGGVILFVGTGMAAKKITQKVAEDLSMPYVIERWLGGTLTNFHTINKRVNYLKELEAQKASGGFEKYTKYEALKLQEKMKKLRHEFGGIVELNRLPEAVWVSSANYDKIAVAEARKKKIPVIGITNTNADPSKFDYPIPGNDSALGAVSFILNSIKDALVNVKLQVKETTTQEAVEK